MREQVVFDRFFWWALVLLCFFLFFFRLGDRSFRNPDEGRYAKISQEMLHNGDFVMPTLYGIDYLRKPPLLYWLVGVSYRLFGESEWSARAVPALFSVFGIFMVYFFMRQFYDQKTALLSSMLLLLNPLYLIVGRLLLIDAVFAFFVTASILFFYLSHRADSRRGVYALLCYGSVSLAFLAKGILAVALPAIGIFVFGILSGQVKRFLTDKRLILGVLIFLVTAGLWLYAISSREPDFWNVFLYREHFERLTAVDFEHQEAWYYYWVMMALFFLPWILILKPLKGFGQEFLSEGRRNPIFYVAVCAVTMIAFLSLSKSKLPTYILPTIPLMSMVFGRAWAKWAGSGRFFYPIVGFLVLVYLCVPFVTEKMNEDYTTKPFAEILTNQVGVGDEVFMYDHPGAFYDFGFYLKRPVKLVGLYGEFEISRENKSAQKNSVTREYFMQRLSEKKHFFCIIRRSDFEGFPEELRRDVRVVHENQRKVLFESGQKRP